MILYHYTARAAFVSFLDDIFLSRRNKAAYVTPTHIQNEVAKSNILPIRLHFFVILRYAEAYKRSYDLFIIFMKNKKNKQPNLIKLNICFIF